MAVNNNIKQIAFGCSNGTVYLFDSSINLLPKGLIQVPYVNTPSEIVSICFMGLYPLLAISNTRGEVYIYSIKPISQC